MYNGDQARKQHAGRARLPPALGPRQPADELRRVLGAHRPVLFTSATPGPLERESAGEPVPAGHPPDRHSRSAGRGPSAGTADRRPDGGVRARAERGERVLVTTLTKRRPRIWPTICETGLRVKYLHSDIDAIERVEILRGCARGLRLPRRHQPPARGAGPAGGVAGGDSGRRQGGLPALETALIQTAGRAARHLDGRVILYAERRARQETSPTRCGA
jgi:excinuclease ABC subunit B